jgi:hypothetical protein
MRHPVPFDLPRWRTSSFTDRGNCVAVAAYDDGHVAVRNSNQPEAGTVLFTSAAVQAWIAGIKAGEFDDLSVRHEAP